MMIPEVSVFFIKVFEAARNAFVFLFRQKIASSLKQSFRKGHKSSLKNLNAENPQTAANAKSGKPKFSSPKNEKPIHKIAKTGLRKKVFAKHDNKPRTTTTTNERRHHHAKNPKEKK